MTDTRILDAHLRLQSMKAEIDRLNDALADAERRNELLETAWPGERCGCAHDTATDVCLYHSPIVHELEVKLADAERRATEARAEAFEEAREAVADVPSAGSYVHLILRQACDRLAARERAKLARGDAPPAATLENAYDELEIWFQFLRNIDADEADVVVVAQNMVAALINGEPVVNPGRAALAEPEDGGK